MGLYIYDFSIISLYICVLMSTVRPERRLTRPIARLINWREWENGERYRSKGKKRRERKQKVGAVIYNRRRRSAWKAPFDWWRQVLLYRALQRAHTTTCSIFIRFLFLLSAVFSFHFLKDRRAFKRFFKWWVYRVRTIYSFQRGRRSNHQTFIKYIKYWRPPTNICQK